MTGITRSQVEAELAPRPLDEAASTGAGASRIGPPGAPRAHLARGLVRRPSRPAVQEADSVLGALVPDRESDLGDDRGTDACR